MEPVEYYYQKDYGKIFDAYLMDSCGCDDVRYLLYALFETGNWNGFATLYKSKITAIEPLFDTSRLRTYNGLFLYSCGLYKEARADFHKAVLQVGEYSEQARDWLIALQLDAFDYTAISRLNFHFASEQTLAERDSFTRKYLHAFERIARFFPYKREKNIDVFVFSGWKDDLGNHLSYANSSIASIHVNINDDAGHELAHILCKESLSITNIFIDEGLAEYFDDLVRGYRISNDPPHIALCDLFANFRNYDQDYSYLYARIFIACLLEHYNGDIESAYRVLESSSVDQLKSNLSYSLIEIARHTETVYENILRTKRNGPHVYVGRSDLYILENI